jgi:hypothetical protein
LTSVLFLIFFWKFNHPNPNKEMSVDEKLLNQMSFLNEMTTDQIDPLVEIILSFLSDPAHYDIQEKIGEYVENFK